MNHQNLTQAPDEEIGTWGHVADLLIVSGILTVLILGSSVFLLTMAYLLF